MYVATYIRNSQAQLLLMAMHVENTVKKLELVVLVFLAIYKVQGPCHLYTRTYIAAHELQQRMHDCASHECLVGISTACNTAQNTAIQLGLQPTYIVRILTCTAYDLIMKLHNVTYTMVMPGSVRILWCA